MGAKLHKAPAREGVAVRLPELEEAIVAELVRPGSDGVLQVPVQTLEPEVTQEQLAGRHPEYIAIDRSSFRLRLYDDLELAKTYTIAVGQAGYATPGGTYEIQTKQVNPTWTAPNAPWTGDLAGQSFPPGPGNPLKARWMGFLGGAGIHGTDELDSLGTAASHGCIRMAIPDVIELYDHIEVGTPVHIA